MKFAYRYNIKKIALGLFLGLGLFMEGCQIFNRNTIVEDTRWNRTNSSYSSGQTYSPPQARVLSAEERMNQYFDAQTAELKKQIKISPVNKVNPKLIHIRFDTDSYFIGNSEVPSEFAKMNIGNLGRVLQMYPYTSVIIESYTDDNGTDDYNDRLSLRRVSQVANYLVLMGVAPQRLKAAWYGKRNSIATNATPEGQRMNRRMEIFVMPHKSLYDKISSDMRLATNN